MPRWIGSSKSSLEHGQRSGAQTQHKHQPNYNDCCGKRSPTASVAYILVPIVLDLVRFQKLSEFLNNHVQDPCLRSRVHQHQGYFGLSRTHIQHFGPPKTIRRKRAHLRDTDRGKANLFRLECALMRDVGGDEGIKQLLRC